MELSLDIVKKEENLQHKEFTLREEEFTTDEQCTALKNIQNELDNSLKPLMSKKQMKKLKKSKQWEEKKKKKRLKEREKQKRKREEAIANGISVRIGPSRKELKKNKTACSTNFLKIAIDLDFDDLMIESDVCKCIKQLLRIYTINRRSNSPAKLYFTGIKENGRIHTVLERNDGYQNWDVEWCFKPYVDVLDKEKIIYLTSDSDEVLKDLDKDSIYIIGGIVDHNHQKGLCFDRAKKLGLKTARLPLHEYVDIKTRTVLSTVHVFEILLRLSEGKKWADTILEVLPPRKGAKLRQQDGEKTMEKKEDT